MIKKIIIEEEILKSIDKGKYVEGSIRKDGASGKLVFRAYARMRDMPGRKPDKLLCNLPNGWLKESAKRLRFYTSQKKDITPTLICFGMQSDLSMAKSYILSGAEEEDSDGKRGTK